MKPEIGKMEPEGNCANDTFSFWLKYFILITAKTMMMKIENLGWTNIGFVGIERFEEEGTKDWVDSIWDNLWRNDTN